MMLQICVIKAKKKRKKKTGKTTNRRNPFGKHLSHLSIYPYIIHDLLCRSPLHRKENEETSWLSKHSTRKLCIENSKAKNQVLKWREKDATFACVCVSCPFPFICKFLDPLRAITFYLS